ncbi:MAG TPA: hypothetical protein VEL05_04725 [Candidatus Acidoferrum sp.]|nr:hypothetical protein [Candidatus Acidoferrum sp.]
MTQLSTIDLDSLSMVTGGNAIKTGYKMGKAVINALKPAKPLSNAENTAKYAKDLSAIGGAGAAGVEVGGRLATGKSPFGLPGGSTAGPE